MFLLYAFIFFIGVNALFGLGFMLIGLEQLSGTEPYDSMVNRFATAFYFSVQTFTTVGYGAVAPEGTLANVLASIDALVGLISVAMVTGILFARFSKPKALIAFSESALICPYRDTTLPSLQFRIANRRDNKIINLRAQVNISWLETKAGLRQRRFAHLPLERSHVTLFPLNWTIVHVIDEQSPIADWTVDDLHEKEIEVIILIEGYDETYAQSVHASRSYTAPEIIWNARFSMMYYAEGGQTILELDRIDEFILLEEEE